MKFTASILLIFSFFAVTGQKVDPAFSNINTAWQVINNFYVDSVDANLLAKEAIVSMLKKLDPHSVFIPADEVKAMNEPLDGNFEGVGIEFTIIRDTLIVVSAVQGGPSQKAGVLIGDRIIAIDGKNIASTGLKNSDVFVLLRGKKGTVVTLSVLRKGEEEIRNFKVERDKIPINSVDAFYMISKSTGYIKVSRFSANTHHEFLTALKKLKKEKMDNLIIDLRSNGGGYLKAALDIVDELLGPEKLMLFTQGSSFPRRDHISTRGGNWEKGGLLVLIDEYSASASEIVAGAVQDWDRGVVVGRRSFGKGLVQRPFNLPDGSEIRLTIAKYYTPSGRSIQKPYEKGTVDYREEVYNRFLKGELVYRDSIHYNNGNIFYTRQNKRVVFGGGGIMPDIFVPLDSVLYTDLYKEIHSLGVFNRFMVKYLDNNRDDLKQLYTVFQDFTNKYEIDKSIWEGLLIDARSFGININNEELKASAPLIEIQIKAAIARALWTSCEYFQILNTLNTTVKNSLDVIENQELYNQLLSKGGIL